MKRKVLVGLAALALAGCESGSGPDDGREDNFRANIDGVAWAPDFEVTAVNPTPGLYSITATRTTGANNYTMVFALHNITGPGTFPLGVVATVFGGTANLSRPPSSGWTTPLNGAAGEIVINTLTSSRMTGTFRFDTEPVLAGSPGNPKVTDGEFNIPITGTGGVALPNQGSKLTGTLGTAFAASGVTSSLTNVGGTSPLLTIGATNGTRSLSISISGMTGPGIYSLSASNPVRTMQVTGQPGNLFATWGSQGGGGSGTVTISSMTVSRIVGSFTGTLVPIGGGATGNVAVSGNFDLGRGF